MICHGMPRLVLHAAFVVFVCVSGGVTPTTALAAFQCSNCSANTFSHTLGFSIASLNSARVNSRRNRNACGYKTYLAYSGRSQYDKYSRYFTKCGSRRRPVFAKWCTYRGLASALMVSSSRRKRSWSDTPVRVSFVVCCVRVCFMVLVWFGRRAPRSEANPLWDGWIISRDDCVSCCVVSCVRTRHVVWHDGTDMITMCERRERVVVVTKS